MRRLVLTLAVCLAVTAGVGTDDAHALSPETSTALRNLSQAELKALIADIDAQGLNTTGSTNVKTGIGRMQVAAGRLAPLSSLGTLAVTASGAVVVWQIADALGLGGYVYRKITGETYGGTLSTAVYWKYQTSGAGGAGPTWDFSSGNTPGPSWVFMRFGDAFIYCAPTAGSSPAWFNTAAAALTGTAYVTDFAATCSPGSDAKIKIRTAAQMEASVQIEPSDAAEYASPPGGATTVSAGTNDTTTPTDPELEAALDAIDPNPGTPGTAVEEDTAVAILDELEPGWDQIALLKPLPNETYTAYVTRLQADGWLGTATSTELSAENEAYGPEAVVRVIVTQGGTTTVYDPLGWPATNPAISFDTDITIRYNPDTAAEAPTSPTETPVTVPPTTVPPPGTIDFSPITDIDWGCRFPYGLICYAVAFTELFDVSPDAPVFSFTLGFANELGGGTAPYAVDLNVMDDYMDMWRSILSVCLWVGAVYWLASRLLGFNAAGDPGEAIDDVM